MRVLLTSDRMEGTEGQRNKWEQFAQILALFGASQLVKMLCSLTNPAARFVD
jgi:hypothetical protein